MENKLEIYFIRHGETEWNQEGRLQGWLDSALTQNGINQIKQLKKHLQTVTFKDVYSSPSMRSYESAKILVGEHFKIKTDARLQEIHLGSWQGQQMVELEKLDGERYFAYNNEPAKYTPDSGESFQQVMERMNDFFAECVENYHYGKILVVSHGVAIRALILSLLNLPIDQIWDFQIEGASVTKISVTEKKPTIDYIGKIF